MAEAEFFRMILTLLCNMIVSTWRNFHITMSDVFVSAAFLITAAFMHRMHRDCSDGLRKVVETADFLVQIAIALLFHVTEFYKWNPLALTCFVFVHMNYMLVSSCWVRDFWQTMSSLAYALLPWIFKQITNYRESARARVEQEDQARLQEQARYEHMHQQRAEQERRAALDPVQAQVEIYRYNRAKHNYKFSTKSFRAMLRGGKTRLDVEETLADDTADGAVWEDEDAEKEDAEEEDVAKEYAHNTEKQRDGIRVFEEEVEVESDDENQVEQLD